MSTARATPATYASTLAMAAFAAAALAADLLTKRWASSALASPREVVDGVCALALAHNPGGAFSLLHGASDAVRLPFFVSVSAVAISAIVLAYARSRPQQWAMRLGLPLLLGGALGNLIDRMRFGYVVDFIELHAKWGGELHRWPTFNVADVAICVGIALVVLDRPLASRAIEPSSSASA